jgi:hypothetical protein
VHFYYLHPQATDKENKATIAKFNQSNPRTLEKLLQYENMDAALGYPSIPYSSFYTFEFNN